MEDKDSLNFVLKQEDDSSRLLADVLRIGVTDTKSGAEAESTKEEQAAAGRQKNHEIQCGVCSCTTKSTVKMFKVCQHGGMRWLCTEHRDEEVRAGRLVGDREAAIH